ncbi:MAG: hypothetical protein ABSB14_08075 [Candidatus Sulfotelmatobacter sp.]
MRKVIVFTAMGAVALVSVWLIGSRVAQSRRDFSYQKALSQFQHDLPVGTPKDEVKKYLDSRNVQYFADKRGGSRTEALEIKIGEDPGGPVCEPWDVYIALEFSSGEVLRQVHIRRSGTCL